MAIAADKARSIIAAALAVAAISVPVVAQSPAAQLSAGPGPCYNGVFPLNPNVANCSLPPRQTRVLGAAPDAGAIINCRGNPQCLSLYVNGGYGWYPGAVLVPGYHP